MDVNGGQLTQTAGNPVWPATTFTGPLVAGNVLHSDGTGNLAGVGEQSGTANTGYATMTQADVVTQAASSGQSAGVYVSANIVIPAQSAALRIYGMITTPWSGASATFGVGVVGNATFFTAAGAASGATRGPVTFSPGSNATLIGQWDNVGTTDVQLMITSTNTGNGVMTIFVDYMQAVNLAS
jgi:hypothetical protein